MIKMLVCLSAMLLGVTAVLAQPDHYEGTVATAKQQILFSSRKARVTAGLFPKDIPLRELHDLKFTGPGTNHHFLLGKFEADGTWGVSNGNLRVVQGKNAALQLAWADQFLLEGIMTVKGLGGWFCLVGWDEGNGFAIHNVSMKESGSPWFVTQFRGGDAVGSRHAEYGKYEWPGEQPFRMSVQNNEFSLTVGRQELFRKIELSGYQPGSIVIGTYDTRYGPRDLSIKLLKIRGNAVASD